MGTILKGALAGGLVLWLWSFVFWAFSGIPVAAMREFKDEAAVEAVLRANAPEPGYYALPSAWVPKGADPSAFGEARMKKIASDFFFAGAVRAGGLGPLGGQMAGSIGGNLLSAGLATLLLLQTAGLGFVQRWLVVEGFACFAWLVGVWPTLVWWGHPLAFVGIELLDFLVGWGLAGVVLAWMVGDRAR